ncbi:PIN domain-containing protein, partial [Escherichia coli]|nr:PIN domain-containing protein [Escherichia coli]MEA0884294.1 PIN domain-containing protein [Escherichia coli]
MKNMMRNEALRIALIDYENCCNLRNISLADYTDLILFAGPLQQTVVLPADTWPDNIRVSIRQIDNISKNNVDFHLVMELGRMTCCSAGNNTWHIISNDKGYDGRHCCKVSDEAAFCLIQRPYISKTLLTRR